MARICIIGAGISGLVAARTLNQAGHHVKVIEKSRSLGGRCATRLWNGHIVDHGVQYFTAVDETFLEAIKSTAGAGLRILNSPICDERSQPLDSSKTRYYLKEGNNRLGKYLASELDVRQESLVQSVFTNSWGIRVEGDSFSSDYDAVIISAPYPQAAALVGQTADTPLYVPCLTAFFEYKGKSLGLTEERYAVVQPEAAPELAWSACENHKEGRVSGDRSVMVVQASVPFSVDYLESESSDYLPLLRKPLEEIWQLPGDALIDQFAHRWRYARRPIDAVPAPLKLPHGTFICGDSRSGSKLESVWLDGLRVAEEVQTYLC